MKKISESITPPLRKGSSWAKKFKRGGRGRRKIQQQLVKEMQDARKRGDSRNEIAKNFGISTSTVSKYTKDVWGKKRGRTPEETVKRARSMVEDGYPKKEVARQLNLDYTTVLRRTKDIKVDPKNVRIRVGDGGHRHGKYKKETLDMLKRFEEYGVIDNINISTLQLLKRFYPNIMWVSSTTVGRTAFTDATRKKAFLHFLEASKRRGIPADGREMLDAAKTFGVAVKDEKGVWRIDSGGAKKT